MKKILLIATMAVLTLTVQAQEWTAPITMNGNAITSDNVADINNLSGITDGSVSYDYPTNTLTIENVAWVRGSSNTQYFAKSLEYTMPLTIIVKGTCELDNGGQQRAFIFAAKNAAVVIKGEDVESSTLKFITGNNVNADENGEMTFQDLTVECVNSIWAIGGWSSSTPAKKLTIDNCNITAHPSAGMFVDVLDIEFIDCEFVKPEGAAFDAEKKAVVYGEGLKLKDVDVEVRATKGTGVENITAAKNAQKVVENGVIYLIRDGKRYNVLGAEVK